jgi:CRP/FNR family transcriptional regulator, cyclic AMP receptor protein
MPTRSELIKASPYFTGLGQADLDEINALFFEKKLDREEVIISEGERASVLYFVSTGAVKVFKTSAEGKEQILSFVRPGETFNEAPFFNGGISPASAQAISPAVLFGISRENMDGVLRRRCQVALNVIGVMAKKLRSMISLVEELSFKRVIGRIAGIILENAGDGGGGGRLTQRDMAAMAGTAREVVGRALKTLEDDRAIRMERHRIIVSDGDALRRIAERI